jgi:tripartite-type tricarboxylate transporter receptor subunit TctC
MIKQIVAALSAVVAISASGTAGAENYPNKPIKLIVGYAPGGFTDVAARLVANALQTRLGQPVVVENRPGATGTIGANAVAKSAPDGYTLLLAHSNSNAVAPALFPKLPYDVNKDFTPIIRIATTPLLLVVNPTVPANDVRSLIALAKKRGDFKFASSGNGSSQHIAGEMFARATDLNMTHVPYKGSSQAITDMLSGLVEINFDSPPPTIQYIKAGKLKALAITSAVRSPLFPEVPTMAEAGVPGFEFIQWFGVVGPANLPKDIVVRLNTEIDAILKAPEMRKKLVELGSDPVGGTAADFAAIIQKDTLRMAKVIKDTGITAE